MEQKRLRVLVAGGAGFIGQHVLAGLLREGFLVSVLDLFRPPGFDTVDWAVGSAADEPLFSSLCASCDCVVFLAANSLPGSSNENLAGEIGAHVRMVVKAAEIACAQKVGSFIFASSGGTVYGPSQSGLLSEESPTRPLSAYGVSKLAIEHYLSVLQNLRGMRCLALRVGNPYGPGQRGVRNQGFVGAAMAAAFGRTTLPLWGDGSVIRDFVYVEDVAEAFVRACRIEDAAGVLNIGSGVGRTLIEIVGEIERATGHAIEVEFHRDRAFDVHSNVLDVSRAERVLGWTPQRSMPAGMALTAQWWQAQ